VVILAITIGVFFLLLLNTDKYATIVIVGLIALYQVYALISFVETTNRNLRRFLESIEYSDFSQSFAGGIGGASFDELNAAFAKVITQFRNTRLEREESLRYLQTVVQHIGVGIIAYGEDGQVELLNTAAKRLLDISFLKQIDDLAAVSPALAERVRAIEAGQRDLLTIPVESKFMQLSLAATELRLRKKRLTLVTFQDIANELNQKEMEAWQNLIRVLTHEIRNSLTPIASLASTASQLLARDTKELRQLSEEDHTDIQDALHTIQKRATGLHEFVDTYRKLTRIPKPDFRLFPVEELFVRLRKLVVPQLTEKGIEFESSVEPEDLKLAADSHLIEQVLINLVLNSIDALADATNPRIRVSAGINDHGRVLIRVSDNGHGIIADAIDKLFVPFFTTKKSGTGIGLSLSRQIMRLHRGELTAQSVPHKGTQFTLLF